MQWILLVLILTWTPFILCEVYDEAFARVAFVFAGGVRSFVLPTIHESIRYNLIHAFCPPSSCIGDVFVRLSIDDNTHDGAGADAHGLKIVGGQEKLSQAQRCLQRINHDSPYSKLIYEIINIGSREEAEEMDKLTKLNSKQKIYRDLDARRYSMYFNRYKAYKLLLKHEKQNRMRYSWVIHARLDMGWGAPMKPFNVWAYHKVWVPDSWPSDVPDSFALLPRNYSDMFFSLNDYFDPPEVMCFGGPNFDPKTLETSKLQGLGYTNKEIRIAQADDCMIKLNLNMYHVYINTKDNITWTSGGFSEMLLRRKLEHFGVSKKDGNFGFSSFFFFMCRFPLNFVCYNVEPRRFIPMADSKEPSETVGVGCYGMWTDMNHLYNTNYGPNCDVDNYRSNYPLVMKPQSTCLIDKEMTDWNFMPFRIRRRGNICLTYEPHPASSVAGTNRPLATGMRPCLKTKKIRDVYNPFYDSTQLFNLYPLSPISYRITSWDFLEGLRCLTVSAKHSVMAVGPGASGGMPKLMVEMARCHDYPLHLSQLFHVELVGKSAKYRNRHYFNSSSSSSSSDSSSDVNDFGWATESDKLDMRSLRSNQQAQYDPILPDINTVIIKWMGENEYFCITHDDAVAGATSTIVTLDDGFKTVTAPEIFTTVGPCMQGHEWSAAAEHGSKSGQAEGDASHASKMDQIKQKANRNTVFVLERMKIQTPTV